MPRLLVLLLLLIQRSGASQLRVTRGQLIAGCCAAALPIGIEAYSRAPLAWKPETLRPLPALDGRPLVLVLHGAGGPDANTKRIAAALSTGDAIIVEYQWLAVAGDTLQAPYNAQRVGDSLADQILRAPAASRPRSLHVVGISVGAFAADRLVARLAAAEATNGGGAPVRLTLLDPFTARGLLGLTRPATAYGVAHFGRGAMRSECVFNTDDPVPSTSLPLRNAVNYDITAAASRSSFTPLSGDSMHSWPAAWFGLNPTALDGSAARERGSVVAVR